MNIFKCFKNTSLFNKTLSYAIQNVRHRFNEDPGSLEQRLFRAVTEAVVPFKPRDMLINSSDYKKNDGKGYGNYGDFLVEKCREDVIESAKGRMLLVFHMNYHKSYHLFNLKSSLFDNGMTFHFYPSEIMKAAAKGTNLSDVVNTLFLDKVLNMVVIGDCSSELARVAVESGRKVKQLLLIGGILDYRIATVDQIDQFIALNSLQEAHANLVRNLSSCQADMATNLQFHQISLISGLDELASRNK